MRPYREIKTRGVFHCKLWLIKFEDKLRVVVGSGNQHVGDWAVWMNAFWYQDFGKGKQSSEKEIDLDFRRSLIYYYGKLFK